MQALFNQRCEKQSKRLLIGGLLLYRDSVFVGVNYEVLYCVVVGCLFYPADGNLLASDTRLYPIREILRELKELHGEGYQLQDYRPPLKQRYVVLAEYTATSLRELNDILERLQRQFEARCFCPSQDRDFAAASQLCQPVTAHDKDFLIAQVESIMEEPDRVKIMDNAKRLQNRDQEAVLAAAVVFHQLEQEDFMQDPEDYHRIEEKEQSFSLSYS